MIECPHCHKSHREPKAVEKCKTRTEAKARRLKKAAEDVERRTENARRESPESYAHRRFRDGTAWVNIAAGLKKDYPAPLGSEPWNQLHRTEWDWALAIMLDTYYNPPKGWSL